MDVTIDSLFSRIGRQTIEIELLKEQRDEAVGKLAIADAEVSRLRSPAPCSNPKVIEQSE